MKRLRTGRKEKRRAITARESRDKLRRVRVRRVEAFGRVEYFEREYEVIPGREDRVRDLRGRRLMRSSVEKDDAGKDEICRFSRDGRYEAIIVGLIVVCGVVECNNNVVICSQFE